MHTTVFFASDPISSSYDIAESAARIESKRIETATENIANANTTSDSPNKLPYRRKVVYIKHNGKKLIAKTTRDKKTRCKKMYSPNHVAANAEGYIILPNVVEEIEKTDLMEAKHRYQANLEMINLSQSIKRKTISLIK